METGTGAAGINRSKGGRGFLTVLGIITIILGIIAIGSPLLTGSLVSTLIGVALLIIGIFELIGVFASGELKAGILAFISGILTIIVGGTLIARPEIGSAVLTIVLVLYFLIDGISRVALAFKVKPISGWGWILFRGVISLVLGLLFWSNWPLSGLWAIGVLVGIRILFAGLGMLLVGAGGE